MKVAIIAPANLPLPAVQGGAIETLINNFIDANEIHKSLDITIISGHHKGAFKQSKSYECSRFIYLHRGRFFQIINLFFRIIRRISGHRTSHLDMYIMVWWIRRLKIETVIVEGNSQQLLELAKYFPKGKLVFHMHADIIFAKSPENEKIVSSVSKIIVGSDYLKRQIFKNTNSGKYSVIVVRNGLKFEPFTGTEMVTQMAELKNCRIPKDVPVILYIGRLVESKGIMQLFLALKNLRGKVPFHFLIVGSFGSGFGLGNANDEFSTKLKHKFSENSDWITLTGFINHSELPVIYRISDLVVVPSLCEDASPLVILEAMASGKALIITDGGGMPEYVTKECALIIKRDEKMIENLCATIMGLIKNRERLIAMGRAGRDNSSNYSSEKYYTDFLRILDSK